MQLLPCNLNNWSGGILTLLGKFLDNAFTAFEQNLIAWWEKKGKYANFF